MQLNLMVMSQHPEQLDTELFLAYLSGLQLYPAHTQVTFDFTALRRDGIEIAGVAWSHQMFKAQVSPAPQIPADTYLVVIDNYGMWMTTNEVGLTIGNSLQPESWANTGSFVLPHLNVPATGFMYHGVPPNNLAAYLDVPAG